MPELPEVQTVVSDLIPEITGMKFKGIESEVWKCVVSEIDFSDLVDKRVEKVWRRGKFIIIDFEDQLVMTMHLRMSGRILVREHSHEPLRFERHRIDFENCSLRFCDQRKFGRIWLSKKENFEQDSGIWRLGIEPFDQRCDATYFKNLVAKKKGPVKKHLLDQGLIAGVGNIYADEACFYAGIRPDRDISTLSAIELEKLFDAVLKALNQGIRNRGTSVSDYEDAYGRKGTNQELLYVYGRKQKPCLQCENQLTGIRLVGRSTVYCEKCQG